MEGNYSEFVKKITFLNGILDLLYTPLVDILIDDNSRTYEYSILVIRKRLHIGKSWLYAL